MKPLLTSAIALGVMAFAGSALSQTREMGPWWPSQHGAETLGSRYEVTLADVRGAMAKEGIAESSIQPADAILLNCGWAVNWTNPSKYNDSRFGFGDKKGSPGIGHEVAKWRASEKVAMVGADSCCVMLMPQAEGDTYNLHLDLLMNGVYFLENMDLRELARDKAYEFLHVNLTERIKGATGSPVRPLAIR